MEERLQKVLAHAGVASRRSCEELILAGKVKVDGKLITDLGIKVDPEKSVIEVAGKPIPGKEQLIYILLYKPAGFLSTVHDPQKRRTVMDLIHGVRQRVYPVGRLDYDTSGLILLTNDGELANDLIHPSREVEKTYRALVKGIPTGKCLGELAKGIMLEDGKTAPAQVRVKKIINGNALVDITIHEGRNRQVRRMFQRVGNPVIRLKRIAFGPLKIGRMKPGEWRYLTDREVEILKRLRKK
ncbi:MAG: pseudouridine synthase [Bacillota bacterium]|nr:rRNA pseudouridine synthase [Clostridia bacterium]